MTGNPVPGRRDPSPRFQVILDEAGFAWPEVRDCLVGEYGYATGYIDIIRGVREPGPYEAVFLACLLHTSIERVRGMSDGE